MTLLMINLKNLVYFYEVISKVTTLEILMILISIKVILIIIILILLSSKIKVGL